MQVSLFSSSQVSSQHTVYNICPVRSNYPLRGQLTFSILSQASLTQEAESALPEEESLTVKHIHTYFRHGRTATPCRGESLLPVPFRRQAWLKWQSHLCLRENYWFRIIVILTYYPILGQLISSVLSQASLTQEAGSALSGRVLWSYITAVVLHNRDVKLHPVMRNHE